MEKLDSRDLSSLNIKVEQIRKLKGLFPEVFTEGNKIDWDKLRLTLGEQVDVGKERFGMNWPGKADCFKTIQQPSIATLVPSREESIDFDTTQNLFIEGDNLEVLKLLQKSYLCKVKMIYIDPPYNTGKDFIYPDNYSETLETYLAYTEQTDDEGRKFATNTDTEGRFHSKWLNMMYPRLFLAKNLLKDDGAIFISIDDNEIDNLKKLCDEIFGTENFVGQITVINNLKGRNDKKNIAQAHEYLIIYQKNNFSSLGLPLSDEQLKAFKHKDNNGEIYSLRDLRKRGSGDRKEDRPNMFFPIYFNKKENKVSLNKSTENDIEIFPKRGDLSDGRWRWGKDTVAKNLNILEPKFSTRKNRWDIDYRIYLNPNVVPDIEEELDNDALNDEIDSDDNEEGNEEISRTSKSKSFWIGGEISSDVGKRNFKELFENKADFPYPKSIDFLKRCLHMGLQKNDIVLDFFAGSAGIAQAVFEMNYQDSGNRKFICVQLPEILDESKAKTSEDRAIVKKNLQFLKENKKRPTISDLSKERIRRAILKIRREQESIVDSKKQTLFANEVNDAKEIDLGVKVFKLSTSNFKPWNPQVEKDADAISTQLELHIEHLSAEAKTEAVLFELLFKSGFELSTHIDNISVAQKKVYSIAEGELLICLEKELTQELIKSIAERKPSRVICLDEGFQNNDQLKTNAVQIMKSKGVVKFQTV